jgi:hypothetical protein
VDWNACDLIMLGKCAGRHVPGPDCCLLELLLTKCFSASTLNLMGFHVLVAVVIFLSRAVSISYADSQHLSTH